MNLVLETKKEITQVNDQIVKPKVFNINEVVINDYFQNKKAKALYIFAVTGMLTANKGYIEVSEYIKAVSEFCNISNKTAARWVTVLKSNRIARIKRGRIHPKGRKRIEYEHNTTKWYIQFHEEHLKSYMAFKYHCIQQIALLLQKRFRYAWKDFKISDAASLEKSGKIETSLAMVRNRQQMGCSISKIQEKLGLAKSTISVALKGYTKKQYNYSLPIKGTIARVKYSEILKQAVNKAPNPYISNKWGFKYDPVHDTYQLSYALASIITAPSYLRKKGK